VNIFLETTVLKLFNRESRKKIRKHNTDLNIISEKFDSLIDEITTEQLFKIIFSRYIDEDIEKQRGNPFVQTYSDKILNTSSYDRLFRESLETLLEFNEEYDEVACWRNYRNFTYVVLQPAINDIRKKFDTLYYHLNLFLKEVLTALKSQTTLSWRVFYTKCYSSLLNFIVNIANNPPPAPIG